jgi:hypothetical protein
MISMDGEVTEINNPPNRSADFREVTIWVDDTEEHIEMTLNLAALKSSGIEVGSKISIKLDKKFDIDSLTQDLMKM